MAVKKFECEPQIEKAEAKDEFLKETPSGRVTFDNRVNDCINYVDSGDSAGGYCVVAEMRCRLAKKLSVVK